MTLEGYIRRLFQEGATEVRVEYVAGTPVRLHWRVWRGDLPEIRRMAVIEREEEPEQAAAC